MIRLRFICTVLKERQISKKLVDNYKKELSDAKRPTIFTEGNKRPTDETISFVEVTDYQSDVSKLVPRVYAFYYTGEGMDENVELTLKGVSMPRDAEGKVLSERKGSYSPSADLSNVLSNFQQVVKDAMYDFAFTYRATDGKAYTGRVAYTAEWKGMEAGTGD